MLLSVSLALSLSGPEPWRARGRASFSILFFDVSFGFDVTIGADPPPRLPERVDVAPLLLAAFGDRRPWSAQLPAGGEALVTLRAVRRARRPRTPARRRSRCASAWRRWSARWSASAELPSGARAPVRARDGRRRRAPRRRAARGSLRAGAVHGAERRREALAAVLRVDAVGRRASASTTYAPARPPTSSVVYEQHAVTAAGARCPVASAWRSRATSSSRRPRRRPRAGPPRPRAGCA